MFDNKFTRKDPLSESVRQVMIENDIRRQVELTLNEQLGIQSRKQLPHELYESYDATLNEAIHNALNENCGWSGKKMEEGKLAKTAGAAVLGATLGTVAGHATKPKEPPMTGPSYSDSQRANLTKRIETMKEESKGSEPRNAKERNLAAKKPPYDKITHADVLKGRGVIAQEEANKALGGNPITRKDPAAPQALEEKSSPRAREIVHHELSKFKKGELHSGSKKGPEVTKRKQAIAIALDVARRKTGESMGKKMDESVEAILEEIRSNLEEQFIYVYESRDAKMMEQFLDSLTEEQAELLGLNEVESGVEGSGTSTIARGWNAFKTGVRNAVVSTPSMQRSIETNVQNASRKAIGDTNEPHKIVSELPTSSMIKRLSSTTPTPTSTPAAPARNSQFDMSNLGQGKVGPSGITGTTQDAKPSTGRESEAATSLSSGGFQFPGRGKNADTAASMATPTAKPTTPAPAPAPSTGGGSGGSSRPSSTSSSSGSSGSSSGYTERSSQGRDWKEKAFSPDTGG